MNKLPLPLPSAREEQVWWLQLLQGCLCMVPIGSTIMEQEKASLKQTVAQMKATIENLQKTQSKQVRKSLSLISDY